MATSTLTIDIDLDLAETAAKLRAAAECLDPTEGQADLDPPEFETFEHEVADATEWAGDTEPRLGFATTRQLLREIVARIECDPADSTYQARLHGACREALEGESRAWLGYTTARWAIDHGWPDGEQGDCPENCTRHRTCR